MGVMGELYLRHVQHTRSTLDPCVQSVAVSSALASSGLQMLVVMHVLMHLLWNLLQPWED